MNLKKNNCLMTSNTDDWRTPSDLYNLIVNKFNYIDCFPFKANYNEFDKTYYEEKLYANPPYSKNKELYDWIKRQLEYDCEILLLIPARTDTTYYHELLKLNPLIYFVKGRLHFNDCKSAAPFPSIFMKFTKYIHSPDIVSCLEDLL